MPPTFLDNDVLPPLSLPRKDLPVGGRLAHFKNRWGEITEDSWVLSVVRKGYKIPFICKPPLSPTPIFLQQTESLSLVEEVNKLLLKGAVEKIEPEGPGFYSRIFLVPKKNGKLRLIIDLSRLNTFLEIQSFKMETANKVRQAIQPNDWAISLDLTDAYLHVPIHRQSRKYLRFFSQGSDVSVQGSPVRPCNKSLCFYPRDGCHSNLSTEEGNCTVSVPGRLVGQKSDSSGNSERSTVYTQVDYVPGTDNQRREVGLGSISELCVYRNGISYTKEYSSSAVRQNTRHSGTITMVRNSRASLSKSLPVSSGKAQCSIPVCRTGQIALTSASDGIVCSVEAPCTPIGAPHSYQCSDQAAIRMLEQQGTFHLGCNVETVSSNSHSVHGCESLRMGSPSRTRRTSVSWSLDSRPISSSYQYSRDESNIAGSETMSSVCRQFDSTDCHEQLFSSLLPEETRGHPFSVSVHGGVGHASLVQSGGHRSSGQTSTRKVEHIGRQVEPSFQANCDRMDLGSDDLQFNSVDDRFSERRPVCNSSQQETASLCIAHSRRECFGDRRNVNELGRNACICFSSICTDPGDNQQDSSTSLQNSTGSSSLGRNVLVSRHTSVTCSTSNSDPLGAESSYTGGSKTGASKSRKSKTSRLEFIRRSITDRKFSANVARHASQARRSSTRRVYDAKWKVFSDWCCQRETHPFNASPMVVADFLLHLFTEKKCQVSTIKGYRSTISNTLKFKSDVNIGSDPINPELGFEVI